MAESQLQRLAEAVRSSVIVKIITIGILLLVLLIPGSMIMSLIREREMRKGEVIEEISSKWGYRQILAGPILSIPYYGYKEENLRRRVKVVKYLHFLPDELKIDGKVVPEIRYRGIYEAVLYNAKLKVEGNFSPPDLKQFNIQPQDLLLDRAFIAMGISDMRGIRDRIMVRVNDDELMLNPGIPSKDVLFSGVSAKFPLKGPKDLKFSLDIDLNGSQQISFIPVGKTTTVDIDSNWSSPSFDGAFLPVSRKIDDKGFEAKWKVLDLNRNFPQAWSGSNQDINSSAFGVRLFIAGNIYQQAMRSAKYALLFIVFTFAAIFFSEVANRIIIHPIQYLLIGLAITMFYILLISLSEHLSFGLSYLIGSTAVIVLIVGYAKCIFNRKALAATIGVILVILYVYNYILLQLEDYALLLGAVGLFTVLALIMYKTRKINWYSLKLQENSESVSVA